MRNIISLLAAVIICFSTPAMANGPVLTIVYTDHLADIQREQTAEALAKIASLLKELRNDNRNVLFVHGGSVFGPSPLSSFDNGTHMVDLLNRLEPSALTLGRRDFMHKEDELAQRTRESFFPMVCSNISDPLEQDQSLDIKKTFIVTSDDGYRIGIAGLVSPTLATTYIQERIKVTGGYELLPELGRTLKNDGADFLIVSADFQPDSPETLLKESDFNILFYNTNTNQNKIEKFAEKYFITHNGENDVVLIELSLKTDTADESTSFIVSSAKTVSLDHFKADPDFASSVKNYISSLDTLLSIPIGQTETEYTTETKIIRTSENAFANLVADAIRAYYGSDIGIMNAGGIRGNRKYPAGSILTRRDMQTEFPLHDVSCILSISGKDLLAALEHGVSGIQTARGQFLHVSGAAYLVSAQNPVGSRVKEVTVHGRPLQPDKVYSVALPKYLAEGGDGYTMLKRACQNNASRHTQELVEIVRNYISNKHVVAPKIEGRIRIE